MTAGVKSAKALNERMFSGLPTLRGARVNAMDTRTLDWNWRGKTVRLGADARGTGPKVLLLPALSSISSRREMQALQERLAPRYSTLAVDWPGFGEAARPQVDWTPDAYAAFLAFLLTSVVAHPYAVIAVGHAATYVLKHAAGAADAMGRLVLIAPTWRGPLPTMAGGQRPFFDRLCRLVDRPGLGPLIYRLNVNPFMVRRMGAGHVYADPAFRHRPSRSAREPRRVSRSGAARGGSDPRGLRRRDAAEVARGNGGACRRSRHSHRAAAPGQTRRARGVSRRDLRRHRALPRGGVSWIAFLGLK